LWGAVDPPPPAAVIVFEVVFQHLGLKARLKDCFQHLNESRIFGAHRIVLWLIVHLLLLGSALTGRELLPQ
jgi:uncharacterized iron-regulated membrane protein